MKNKIIVILVAIIILLVGCISIPVLKDSPLHKNKIEDKSLLTYEKSISDTGEIVREVTYQYNSEGFLIESIIYEYDGSTTFKVIDSCVYNDKNKPITRNRKRINITINEVINEYFYEYFYDDSGVCITESIIDSNGGSSITNYEYDADGNCNFAECKRETDRIEINASYNEYNHMIKQKNTYYSKTGEYLGEEVYTYNKLYNEGKCIEEERISDYTNAPESTGMFMLLKDYTINTLDENGNKIIVKRYAESFVDDTKESIERNGVEYKIDSTTYYTYSKLSDLITTTDVQSSACTATTTTAPPKRLSDDCDKILSTGTNQNGDYYEIVVNQKEDYNGLVYFVGVIKNNEWLLEPTSDMPFVLENGSRVGDVFYLGNNCFISKVSEQKGKYDFSAPYQIYTVYNVENKKTYSTLDWQKANYNVIPLIESNKDEYMIIGYKKNSERTEFMVLNKIDMTVSTVEVKGYLKCFSNISEDIFCVGIGDSNYPKYYFYNLNGNIVLDLSEYKTTSNQSVFFSNGTCSIDVINNNNTEYTLTIDKTGEVIDSYKVS